MAPTQVLLPGKSHERRSLGGCSPWGRKESDTTERLHFHFHALEKEMATHSNVLAWRIPGMTEPGGLPSMRSHRVGHDWSNLAAAVVYHIIKHTSPFFSQDFPGGSDGKSSAYNAGDPGSIPRLGRSSGEGNGNPLQCSWLENSMDRGAWWATVHELQRIRHTFTFSHQKILSFPGDS